MAYTSAQQYIKTQIWKWYLIFQTTVCLSNCACNSSQQNEPRTIVKLFQSHCVFFFVLVAILGKSRGFVAIATNLNSSQPPKASILFTPNRHLQFTFTMWVYLQLWSGSLSMSDRLRKVPRVTRIPVRTLDDGISPVLFRLYPCLDHQADLTQITDSYRLLAAGYCTAQSSFPLPLQVRTEMGHFLVSLL